MKRNANLMILSVLFLLGAEQTPAQQKGTDVSRSAAQQSVVPPVVRLSEVPNKQGKTLVGFVVEWKQGRLTVDAESALLSRVLQEVATQTGITFLGWDKLHTQISVHYSNVPLSAGLQILLAHTDYAMMGDPGNPSTMRIITMDRMLPAQKEIVQAETAPRRGKDSPQPEIQADQLVDFSVLAQALSDKDAALKEAAIQALAQSEGTQAMDLLRQAFSDLDPTLKTMMIENIGSRPDAVPLLLEASQDSKESVREAARAWLDFRTTQP